MKTKTKYLVLIIVIIVVLIVDLVTKAIFGDITFKKIIPHLIDFESNQGNEGAAFGILSGKKWLLIVLAFIFLILMFALDIWFKSKSKLYTIGFGFVVGGAVGNLIDRIWLGSVRDFIKFDFWKSFPTFNVADSFLCVGVFLLCVYFLFFNKTDKNHKAIIR